MRPTRDWTYRRHRYLSGDLLGARRDTAGLGLTPLRLEEQETWTPEEHYWGDEPIESCLEPDRRG